jgi:hypothetical protein
MMEMLARFERGESEGGEGGDVNGLEELLKGMGGIGGEQDAVDEEVAADEGFDALETLKLRLSDGSDLGSSDDMRNWSKADILLFFHRKHGTPRSARTLTTVASRTIPLAHLGSRLRSSSTPTGQPRRQRAKSSGRWICTVVHARKQERPLGA